MDNKKTPKPNKPTFPIHKTKMLTKTISYVYYVFLF